MSYQELKPCPFCGGRAEDYKVMDYPKEIGERYSVVCTKCGAQISTIYQQRAKAIRVWNERVS